MKQYVLVNFKSCVYALVVNSNLDLLNLIISIMNDDDDEIILNGIDIINRSNGFQLHQEHQAIGGVVTVINITGIGYIGEPKPGSPRYSGTVSEVQNGKSIGVLSLKVYMHDLIQKATRYLYDKLNEIV